MRGHRKHRKRRTRRYARYPSSPTLLPREKGAPAFCIDAKGCNRDGGYRRCFSPPYACLLTAPSCARECWDRSSFAWQDQKRLRRMRIKFARRNANEIDLCDIGLQYYNHMYDRQGDQHEKCYFESTLGQEFDVYGVVWRAGFASFFVKDPRSGDVTHAPSVCFDIIDERVSSLWHYKSYTNRRYPIKALGSCYEVTWLVFKEWAADSRFYEHYVNGREREVLIMNKYVAQIHSENSDS